MVTESVSLKVYMSLSDEQQETTSLLRRILKHISLDWVSLALDLVHSLRHYLCSQPTGPYEILDYDATLELLDVEGKKAVFRKRQSVKFLQNNIIAFEDYAWGDGEILATYKCSPGVVVDKYREGDRWNILISLRDTKSIGDIEQFHIERKVKNTYTHQDEWLQTEIRRRTQRLRMAVIFPKGRNWQDAVLTQRSKNQTIKLGSEHFNRLPDGRRMLSWETKHTRGYEVYTLKWRW
jgi:hypothetical protein